MRVRLLPLAVVTSAAGLAAGEARAQVFKDEPAALRAAFPDAERFEPKDVLLTEPMLASIEKLARARVRERLVTFYTARRGAVLLGYAVIHTHIVRTKRETFAISFAPDGTIRTIEVIAFFEPPEYRPSERWLGQLVGKGAEDRLAVGDDLAPMSGATLSARGVAERARWLLQALRAARAAGIPTVITTTAYTVSQRFDDALMVLPNLGDPDQPLPPGIVGVEGGWVDLDALRRAHVRGTPSHV